MNLTSIDSITRRVLVENLNYKYEFKQNSPKDTRRAWNFFDDLGGYSLYYVGGGWDVYENNNFIVRANEVLERLKKYEHKNL